MNVAICGVHVLPAPLIQNVLPEIVFVIAQEQRIVFKKE